MPQLQESIADIVERHGRKKENLLKILQDVVKQDNYLSENSIEQVAREMDLSTAEVFGVASFYTFLDVRPRGQNIIRICKTICCDVNGKQDIIDVIEDQLRIKCGETTPDQKFTLMTTNCMGWCHKGPAMLINDKVYTELTPEKALKALEEYL